MLISAVATSNDTLGAASRRPLLSISLASHTLPFGPLRYPRANPRAIGTQYPDFFAGSLARVELCVADGTSHSENPSSQKFPKNM
jgi:hypothetical protein